MNKVALVTGGGRGIGRAIALTLAREGYDVAVNYNGSREKARQVCREIESLGRKAVAVKADVSDFARVENMVSLVVETFGRIDVLVNNSGITKDGLMMRMKEEDFDSVININLKGTFNCTKAVSKIMMKQRSGSIINMSSVIGLVGNIGQANYAASKAGILGLTKASAKELASRNIRVNAIAPGFIQSDMTDVLSDELKAGILNNIAMKKFGTAQDVADMAAFLAGDKSRYITGQVFNVDGGMVM